MDSLHLFTIPKWLPNILLPELWTIIFCWKWRLEMKDIHKVLIPEVLNCRESYSEIADEIEEYSYKIRTYYTSGNIWCPFGLCAERDLGGVNMDIMGDYTQVIPKCGVEYVSWLLYLYREDGTYLKKKSLLYEAYDIGNHGDGQFSRNCSIETIHKNIANNHGIICSETLNWEETVRLLRYV
jgi:hypothetical protein